MTIFDLWNCKIYEAVESMLDEDEDLHDAVVDPVLDLARAIDDALYEWRVTRAEGRHADEVRAAALAVSEAVLALDRGLPTSVSIGDDDDDDAYTDLDLSDISREVARLVIDEGVPVLCVVREIHDGPRLVLSLAEHEALDALATEYREYMSALQRAREQFARARVPEKLMSADEARVRIAIALAAPDRTIAPGEVLAIAVTPGAGKSSGAQAAARTQPALPLAYVARDHRLTRQVCADLLAPSALPARRTTRRMGILSPRGDQDDTPLCLRPEEAKAILEAGGSPARLLCATCRHAPPHGGACKAYGGSEGSAPDALVTVPHLSPVVDAWCVDQDLPPMVIIDEPPPVTDTVVVSSQQVERAIVVLRAARAGLTAPRALPKRRHDRRGPRKLADGRYRLGGPAVEPAVAIAVLPALELVRRLLASGRATEVPYGVDPATIVLDPAPPPIPHTATAVADAARDLLRASVDHAWGQRRGVVTTWVDDLRDLGLPVGAPPATADWERLDPTPWIDAASGGLSVLAPVTSLGDDRATVGVEEALSEPARSTLAAAAEDAPRALDALRALSTGRTLARWLAPQRERGLPQGVARVVDRTIVVTAPSVRAAELLGARGHLAVLDATPDRAGLAAAARWVGRQPVWLDLDVDDGADVRREMIYASASAKRILLAGGEVQWDALGSLLVHALERIGGDAVRTVLVVTHKAVADALRPILHLERPHLRKVGHEGAADALRGWYEGLPGRQIILAHYHAIRGQNAFRWRKDEIPWIALDACVTIGDPYPTLDHARDAGILLGLDAPMDRVRQLAADELAQAHGRLRAPVRPRPGLSVHLGQVVPTGWHPGNAALIELERGRPPDPADMSREELLALIAAHGSAGALARAAMVAPSTISRYLSGKRILTASTAERLRAAPLPPGVTPPVVAADVVAAGAPSEIDAPATDADEPPPPAPTAPPPIILPQVVRLAPPRPLPVDDDEARALLCARVEEVEGVLAARLAALEVALADVTDERQRVAATRRWLEATPVTPAWPASDAERAARLLGGVPAAITRLAAEQWWVGR
ncbi:MAG: hypothetical protein KF878_12780 [Planctomycetes bacterium]|nr:hypothetical protein [Planctomycetota bacterium]